MKTLALCLAVLLVPMLALATEGPFKYQAATGDTLVKTGSGILHTVVCASADAAATAGSVAIRDGIAAGGGTVIATIAFAAAFLAPATATFDVIFGTGLYLDFTTTADVSCTATYR